MRNRRPSPEHQEAVSRRLAQLSAELATTRPVPGGPEPDDPVEPEEWWSEHTRIAAPRPALPVPSEPAPAAPEELAPVVPRPGRHASRRRLAPGRVLAGLLPEPLRGPVGLGPAHLAVVAVLVAVGLAVTCWWVVRGDAEPAPGRLETAARDVPPAVPGSPDALETPAPQAAAGPSGTLTVDVAGKVRRPGIAVLDAGSRVVDALEAAGGARRGVDLTPLNLARPLVDGEQVLVGAPAAPAGTAGAAGAPTAPAGALVNLNTATPAELELLPEVGPVTAQAIAAWREQHGGFTAVDELLEVDGIGAKTLATISPHVTV